MANTGFKDSRNAAELLLAPARPERRQLAKLGSLKLSFGVPAALPGVISKASDLTGALRHQFGSIVDLKLETESLSRTLSSTLLAFDAKIGDLQAGRLPSPSSLFTETTGALPGAEDFLHFSTLHPGQTVPASFTGMLNERKSQLQSLTARLSSTFTGNAFKGVSLKENFTRHTFPLESDIDVPTIPKLAQGGDIAERDDILKDKRRFAVVGVHIGSGKPSFWSRLLSLAQIKAMPNLNPVVNQIFKDRKNAGSWSEPTSPFAAQYPYNKVQQTESGHVIELDDTPGAERVHIFHRSGSFVEMHPDGTVVYKNMKDGYDLTMGDKFVKVAGACHISVDGNATLHTKGNVDIQCDGEFNVQSKKDFNVYATNINLRAKRTFKADGIKMDLRYINLPTGLIPVPMGGGFAPRINIAAIKKDFPLSNINSVLAKMAKNPLDPKVASLAVQLKPESIATPPENPLSHPGVYVRKTADAARYRNRFFDTPEETNDFEQYAAHIGLQQQLGDITDDPRVLGGKLAVLPVVDDVKETATVNYLNFDDFKGTFDYDQNFQLGDTSFHLHDIVDSLLYPTIIVAATNTSANTTPAPTVPDPNDPLPPTQ
jgi:hypothetical protein